VESHKLERGTLPVISISKKLPLISEKRKKNNDFLNQLRGIENTQERVGWSRRRKKVTAAAYGGFGQKIAGK